jgi:hypothetical protein
MASIKKRGGEKSNLLWFLHSHPRRANKIRRLESPGLQQLAALSRTFSKVTGNQKETEETKQAHGKIIRVTHETENQAVKELIHKY